MRVIRTNPRWSCCTGPADTRRLRPQPRVPCGTPPPGRWTLLGHGCTRQTRAPAGIRHYVRHLGAFLDAIGAQRASVGSRWAVGWSPASPSTIPTGSTASFNAAGGSQADPEVIKRIIALSMAAAENRAGETITGQDQMVDGRQVQGLRRHRRQPPAVYRQRFRRRDARHHGPTGSRIRQRNLLGPRRLWRDQCTTLVLWTSDDPTADVGEGDASRR